MLIFPFYLNHYNINLNFFTWADKGEEKRLFYGRKNNFLKEAFFKINLTKKEVIFLEEPRNRQSLLNSADGAYVREEIFLKFPFHSYPLISKKVHLIISLLWKIFEFNRKLYLYGKALEKPSYHWYWVFRQPPAPEPPGPITPQANFLCPAAVQDQNLSKAANVPDSSTLSQAAAIPISSATDTSSVSTVSTPKSKSKSSKEKKRRRSVSSSN